MKNQQTSKSAAIWTSCLLLLLAVFNPNFIFASGLPSMEVINPDGQSLELLFQLPEMELKTIQADNQQWQIAEIQGSTLHGATGQPGIPILSHLIAVPTGMTVSVEILSAEHQVIKHLKILPIQDPAAKKFAYSIDAYSNSDDLKAVQPIVRLGRPAIMAGQTVVPLTLQPLDYDPLHEEAVVWTEARLKLKFIPDPNAQAKSGHSNRPLASSFFTQLENQVLGFNDLHQSELKLSGNTYPGLGTYVAVHSGSSTVTDGIEPLLEWRRHQGYHVTEINTALVGNNTTAIKNALQNIYDDSSIPPLEFIAIFGDANGSFGIPTFIETLSGYNGGGDHYYTMLDGDDILSDAHIGRISFRDLAGMNTVIAKILGYEKSPPMDDPTWYGRACLQGDPSDSGITTIYTNQWLKGQLLGQGWSQVDTTWSGNFVNPMMSQVGAGVTAYGYRGFYGTSGIGLGHIQALGNQGKLAIALLPTCSSGNFNTETTSTSEAWFRAPNGGAVAAIGTSTSGTHTRYNNCYYVGAWDGLLNGGDYRIGAGHTVGKVALYSGYHLAEPNNAEIWAVWNNIMGDPATEMWTGVPQDLSVVYSSQISLGAQGLSISVQHAGSPVARARVSVYRENGSIQISGLTDEYGQVMLNLPALEAGALVLTVTGHNLLPHLGGLTVGEVDVFCGVTSRTLDNSFTPGATINLTPFLSNHGTTTAYSVTGDLTVQSGPATISGGSLSFGTIDAGAEVSATTAATIDLAPDARHGDSIIFLLTASNGSETWTSLLEETVMAADFQVSEIHLAEFGISLDPGESGHFDLSLTNLGGLDANSVSATLSTDSPWITIDDNTALFGDIPADGSGRDLVSPFHLNISSDCYGGHLATFELAISYNNGMQSVAHCAAVVGTAASDQPTGPDAYGYYAFDNTDEGSYHAPTYEWVGIDPDHGGQGTDLGLTDFGWEQDDTKSIDLPFEFSYYGTHFNRVSICSNGWLAMGNTPINFYRNFPLPASHSAGSLIAPFWDNLNQTGNHRVYTWYDSDNHRFIIQWYEMPNHFSGAVQNFEVILLDPDFHPTTTGDGMIIFQYDQVNNTDSRDGYATVGIQNSDRTIGLNYGYWNQYAPGAAPIAAGRAILFRPMAVVALPSANITPNSLSQSLVPEGMQTQYVHIANNGAENSILNFSISKVDPAIMNTENSGQGQDEQTFGSRNLTGSQITSSVSGYDPDSTFDLPLSISCLSPDEEYIVLVSMDLPAGVTVNSATHIATNFGPMIWNEQTGDGVETSWGDPGFPMAPIVPGETATCSLNLTISPGMEGDIVIPWVLQGDEYGGAPHVINGELVLSVIGPTIHVSQPENEWIAFIADELDVIFSAYNGPSQVDIALQREDGGNWETLATNLAADSSPWSWTVSGDPGPFAQIRVSDTADPSVFGLSGIFKVSRNLDWLQPQTQLGYVDAGQTVDLEVIFDATGLAIGSYVANLLIVHNGGPQTILPISLTVAETTPAAELPMATTLYGNHPNPFNPQTVIRFSLSTAQNVTLRVYSARGQLVRSLLGGHQQPGVHHAIWDGQDTQGRTAASGVYFYRLVTQDGNFTGKMVLTK